MNGACKFCGQIKEVFNARQTGRSKYECMSDM